MPDHDPDIHGPSAEDLLSLQDGAAGYVASLTGVRAQFEDNGWSRDHAAALVLNMIQSALIDNEKSLVQARIELATMQRRGFPWITR